jgi:TonB family protein
MTRPVFSRAIGFSLALHLSLVIIALIIASISPSRKIMPSYVVTLVAPPGDSGATTTATAPEPAPAPQTKAEPAPQKKSEAVPVVPKQTKQEKRADEQLLSDRIAALKSKKKIDKMVTQRRMAEISKSKKAGAASAPAAKGGKPGGGDYISLVTTKIHQNWIYPEASPQNLEMTLLLRIRKDGSASVAEIIKSSGNPLFDRSVQRAIVKASPFPPPPQEEVFPMRFTP